MTAWIPATSFLQLSMFVHVSIFSMLVSKYLVSLLVGTENFLCLSIVSSFPFSRYCKHEINSMYVQVFFFCVCSTFQKLRVGENFRRIVGGPSYDVLLISL